MNKIRMDMDQLNKTIKNYENNIRDLRNYKSNIKSSLNDLNRGWSGEAKEAFTNLVSVDWDKAIDSNIEKLTFFYESLKKVRTAYENINNEAGKLKNKI